jgi:hypothetical protein
MIDDKEIIMSNSRGRPGLLALCATRYRMSQFSVLIIMLFIIGFVVLLTWNDLHPSMAGYAELEKKRTLATASIDEIELGHGKWGRNFITYQFLDAHGRLVKNRENVGGSIDGRPTESFREGETIAIRLMLNDPSISHIVNNTGLITTIRFCLSFALLARGLVLMTLFTQILRIFRTRELQEEPGHNTMVMR